MSTTKQQIENLKIAYELMFAIPAKKINLDVIRGKGQGMDETFAVSDKKMLHKCNTHGCVAGHLSAQPHFKLQGLRYDTKAEEIVFGKNDDPKLIYSLEGASTALFGDPTIFEGGSDDVEGKKEALKRIRVALREADGISKKRNKKLQAIEEKIKS